MSERISNLNVLMSDIYSKNNERVKIANDALIFPFMQALPKKRNSQKLRWTHGVQTLEDIPEIYLDQYREGVSTIDHTERTIFFNKKKKNGFTPDIITGNWMYGGILYDHFGHFLSESVHRLWYWKQCLDSVEGILFLTSGPESVDEFASYYEELFELWEIDKSKIKLVTDISTVETLYLPHPGSTIGDSQPKWYEEVLENLTNLSNYQNSTYPEKVVFSRQNFLHSGKIVGFEAIESYLTDSGYTVIYPEECSLTEQIKYIINAKEVVWEEGSNIHVLDILPRQNIIAYIFKRRRGLKTFDIVLEKKVAQLNIFDLTKRLSYPHNHASADFDGRQLVARDVSRLSLSVISRIGHLRRFLIEVVGMISLLDNDVFDRFIYDLFFHESQDINTFAKLYSSSNAGHDCSDLSHHLMTQYIYIRSIDTESSSLLKLPAPKTRKAA